jgi:hypothetical protein
VNRVDTLGLIKGVHFDYSRSGERFIHYGNYRFNSEGQLVEHTGRVIKNVPNEAKNILEWLRRVKPDFFKGGTKCEVGPVTRGPKGSKGIKGGGTVLGILSFLPTLLDVYEAQKLADETGLSVWTIMYYRNLGYEIVIIDDMI